MTEREMVSIKGLDKAAVLTVLYSHSKAVGAGLFQARSGEMTVEIARNIIDNSADDITRMFPNGPGIRENNFCFDYLYGRPLKINLEGDELDPWGYDRDNGGTGTAARLIESLR